MFQESRRMMVAAAQSAARSDRRASGVARDRQAKLELEEGCLDLCSNNSYSVHLRVRLPQTILCSKSKQRVRSAAWNNSISEHEGAATAARPL